MRNNRIFIDKTPLDDYFEDLFIQWTDEDVSDKEILSYYDTELKDITLNPNYIDFHIIGVFPTNGQPLIKYVRIDLKDRLTAVNKNGIKAIIRQPSEYLTVPYARVEPYLVMFDLTAKTDKITYNNLDVKDPLSVSIGDGALFIGAEPPSVGLEVHAEAEDANSIKLINGLHSSDGNITLSGGNNIGIAVSNHPFPEMVERTK